MNLFDIRKTDSDKEKICNCISCNETSTSLQVESMYEIKLMYPSKKLAICNTCLEKLRKTINQM